MDGAVRAKARRRNVAAEAARSDEEKNAILTENA